MRLYAGLGIVVLQALFVSPFACAQTLNSQQMEGLMNQYDRPSLWSPPQSNNGNQIIRPNGFGALQQPVQNGYGAIQQQQQPPVQKVSPFQALFGGGPKPAPPPPKPVNPLQYVMQQFLGGGSSSGNAGQDSQKLYNAQEYLQTANDQASRAEMRASAPATDRISTARQQASSEAYYAAQAAQISSRQCHIGSSRRQ